MWEPAAEYDTSFAPAWQWILNHNQASPSLQFLTPTSRGERMVRIQSRANPCYAISAHPELGVVLMPIIGRDAHQLWLVDDAWHKDKSFALINKATGQALSHGEPQQQVSLCDYRPWDVAVGARALWQFGADAGNSYFALRASISGFSLYLDVCEERVEEGAGVLACDWKGGLHQMWGFQPVDVQYTLRSRIDTSHALCANPQNRSNPVGLSFLNEEDDRQLWTVDVHFDQSVTLRSVASGLVLRAGSIEHDKARLSDVKDAQHFTVWLLGRDEGASFFALRPINQLALTLDVVGGKVDAGSTIALSSASKPTQSSFGWWEVAGLRQRQLWGFFPKGGSASVRPV